MTTDPLASLIDSDEFRRFLGRTSTPADDAELQRVAEQAGVGAEDLKQFRATLTEQLRWRQLAQQHGLDPDLLRHRWRRDPVSRHRLPWWASVAAAVTLIAGGSVAGYRVLHRSSAPGVASEAEVRTIATTRGQRMALRLSDGTQVILAPATTLKVPVQFGAGVRDVTLEGTAYFAVTHDADRPFRVRAGNLVAEDLGTEFVVRADPGDADARAEVIVREGRVAIGGAVIRPGEAGSLLPDGTPAVVVADTAAAFGWTEGRLAFRRTRLDEVTRQIGRWFDLDIRLASPALAERNFTATFRANETAAGVLRTIEATLHLQAVQTGPRRYTLRTGD